MCQYIKDDGEQCGRSAEPFCHQHEDTRFAVLYEKAESDAQSGSDFGTMDTTCDECGASLRRVERFSEHSNRGRTHVFEAVVECDCSEHVLGTKAVGNGRLPEGWT